MGLVYSNIEIPQNPNEQHFVIYYQKDVLHRNLILNNKNFRDIDFVNRNPELRISEEAPYSCVVFVKTHANLLR